MIDKGYFLMMARYNTWQNKQIIDVVKVMDEEVLYVDHMAFFGSIMATLNHIMWGDQLWMNRWCADVDAPVEDVPDWARVTDTPGDWQAERFRLDGRMRIWAQTLSNVDLAGPLTWRSTLLDKDFTQPKALCIIHMFNHQTHHRGQVHAILTASGHAAPTTDLVFMPEDA